MSVRRLNNVRSGGQKICGRDLAMRQIFLSLPPRMKSFLHQILLISVFVCLVVCAIAQPKRAQILQAKIASGYGSVQNLDNEIFNGKVTFNDNQGIVTVENDGESRSFTPKKAISFEFEDMELSRHRVFHVFDYTDKGTGFTNPAFFEVLGEFESFAVLAKIDPVEVKPQKGIMPRVPSTMVGSDHTKVAFQKETIFIMNDTGEIEPYLELREKEIEGVYVDTRSQRKKYIDRDLLQEYTGTFYPELEAFARDNDLRFNVKEDLIKILAHYKHLIDN
jgi:hypothetical protein